MHGPTQSGQALIETSFSGDSRLSQADNWNKSLRSFSQNKWVRQCRVPETCAMAMIYMNQKVNLLNALKSRTFGIYFLFTPSALHRSRLIGCFEDMLCVYIRHTRGDRHVWRSWPISGSTGIYRWTRVWPIWVLIPNHWVSLL